MNNISFYIPAIRTSYRPTFYIVSINEFLIKKSPYFYVRKNTDLTNLKTVRTSAYAGIFLSEHLQNFTFKISNIFGME